MGGAKKNLSVAKEKLKKLYSLRQPREGWVQSGGKEKRGLVESNPRLKGELSPREEGGFDSADMVREYYYGPKPGCAKAYVNDAKKGSAWMARLGPKGKWEKEKGGPMSCPWTPPPHMPKVQLLRKPKTCKCPHQAFHLVHDEEGISCLCSWYFKLEWDEFVPTGWHRILETSPQVNRRLTRRGSSRPL